MPSWLPRSLACATHWVGALVTIAMLAWAVINAAPASAQAQKLEQPGVTILLDGAEIPDSVRRTVEELSKAGANVVIRQAPATTKTAAGKSVKETSEPAADEAGSTAEHVWNMFVEGFNSGNAAVPAIASLPGDFATAWNANRNSGSGPNAFWRILLALGGTLMLAWLARQALWSWLVRFGPQVYVAMPFSLRLRANFWRLIADGLPLALFYAASTVAVNALLPEADIARTTAHLLRQSLGITGLYLVAGRFLLSPGEPSIRLLALPRADRHFRTLGLYGMIGAFTITSIGLTTLVASDPHAAAGWFTLWGFLLLALKLWWFWDARADIRQLILSGADKPETVSASRGFFASLAPFALMATAVAIWAVSRAAVAMADGVAWGRAAGVTQFVVVLVPILAEGASQFARCQRQFGASASTKPDPLRHAISTVIERIAGAAVWIIGVVILGRLWSVYLLESMSGGGTWLSHLIAFAVVFCVGGIIFIFAKAFFDAYAPMQTRNLMPGAEEEDAEDHVPSRLATVLPVIRGAALGAIVALTALICLSRIGVDTGPLVAGFGILGLAISFGSQALVRDIVSGMFFMIEDAFRVGEYIDTGKLKGTVEKISLRSIVLRHQSGQIHTVPFGQIASVTNASRDWATIKFNLRLDHSADIEKARKTIKKVGIEMAADPELGTQIIMPLKMQGVSDITDSAVIVRIKFTAKPAQASLMQREGLKRIYRALNEASVPFATGAVTVRGYDDQSRAGGAAAQAALNQAALTPAG